MANPTLTIAGVDRTGKTKVNTVSFRRSINDRSSMSCELIELTGAWRPVVGNRITVDHNGSRRFNGYIEKLTERPIPGAIGAMEYRLDCADRSRLLDWRLYAGSFDAGVTFSSVVTAIYNAKIANDGVTLGTIPDYPILASRIQDGMRPVQEWFRKLTTETGYIFRIDENDVLQFGPLSTSPVNPAPFSISFTSENWRDLEITRELGDYRNRQYVRTEYTISGELIQTYIVGANRDFFQDDGPFSGTPVVTLDIGAGPVAQTVGRFGFDSYGFDCYYDVEGWGIHRYPYDAAWPGHAVLKVAYHVRFNNSVMQQDDTQIAARAAIQNDSGLIEAISEDRYIDTRAALESRATALLRQFGAIPVGVRYGTDSVSEPLSDSLEPGMRQSIDLTDGPSDVAGSFLVHTVDSSWTATGQGDIWFHRVECTDLEPYGQRLTSPIEKLAEAVRIGPDIETVVADSPDTTTGLVTIAYE